MHRKHGPPDVRETVFPHESGIKMTFWSIIINCGLIVLKLIGGVFGNSYALISDAMHSLSDVATDIGVYFGLKISSKPKDVDHRYGHGKVDNYVAHVMGVFLVLVSIGMTYQSAKALYIHKEAAPPGVIALIMVVISIIVKEGLYQATVRIGKKEKSRSMIANAWHHRSDALSSVAAMIGIGVAMIWPKLHVVDQFMGLVIAVFVAKIGVSIAWDSYKVIIDTSPSGEFLDEVTQIAAQIDGVINVHDVRARFYASAIFIDMHLGVNPSIPVREGHAIAKRVENRLLDYFADVVDVTTHVDPVGETKVNS